MKKAFPKEISILKGHKNIGRDKKVSRQNCILIKIRKKSQEYNESNKKERRQIKLIALKNITI